MFIYNYNSKFIIKVKTILSTTKLYIHNRKHKM